MNQPNRQKPISVEELLRIKRSEKPTDEFWKDWQARYTARRREVMLVEKSWWKDVFPRMGIAVARWYLPVGAAAVVTMTFFAVREYNPSVPVQDYSGATVSTEVEVQPKAVQMAPSGVLRELREAPPRELNRVMGIERQPGAISSTVVGIEQEGRMSPTERAIAANLAAVHAMEPELTHSWRGRSFVTAVNTGNRALDEEPLANVSANRDLRRVRTLGFEYQSTGATGTPSYSRQPERWISRLNEEQLYEVKSGSVGARGDRVLVRF